MFPKSLEVGFDGEQRLLGDGGIGARAVNSSVLVAKTAPRGRQFAMLPTVEMRFRPLENIHARYIRDAFLRQRAPERADHEMPDQRRVRPKRLSTPG
jgi:hypothetical protein